MHGSKLPLTVWFWAAYLMATHSNGIAALQLQAQLGLGSYKSAWLLVRQAAPGHGRSRPLAARRPGGGRRDRDPLAPQGRSAQRRARTQRRGQDAGRRRRRGARRRTRPRAPGARSRTSPPPACTPSSTPTSHPAPPPRPTAGPAIPALPASNHDPHVVGPMAAHIVLPWTHRLFANLKSWALGVYHGLRRKAPAILPRRVRLPLQSPPHPPRRLPLPARHRRRHKAATYNMLIAPEATA